MNLFSKKLTPKEQFEESWNKINVILDTRPGQPKTAEEMRDLEALFALVGRPCKGLHEFLADDPDYERDTNIVPFPKAAA